jgi:glycosyltransferase involved in cell wall biosynthesis
MNILFLHRNFPAQFRHVLIELAKDQANKIVFITNTSNTPNIKGVNKFIYKTKREVPKDCHNYLRFYEDAIIHGQACAEAAIFFKNKGFEPDIIYGHTWGPTMFMKDIFPDVPLICYFEWFYNSDGGDVGFNRKINENDRARTRCLNSHLLVDLYTCDKGISPTKWQKEQFPKEFHDKIEVLHEGIDINFFVPNPDAKLKIPNTDIELSAKDEVITYATRGMEQYRGFPQFMEAAEKLLKQRPKVHIVIGGEDRVCYGPKLVNGSFKQLMLDKLDLDMNRVHFTGSLPYTEYLKILQISSVHVYLTYPFVLSWSMLEAMSAQCCIVASDTPPVLEVMQDNYNGLLVDFFDVDGIIEKVNYALNQKEKMHQIRQNARKTIIKNFALHHLLPQHIDMIKKAKFKKLTQLKKAV